MTLKLLGQQFSETKSEKAYNDLYHRIKPGLSNYIYQIVKDRNESDKLVFPTTFKFVGVNSLIGTLGSPKTP